MFPVEIWEEILPHMDAVTLTKWRLVCSDFNWLIDKILKVDRTRDFLLLIKVYVISWLFKFR